MCRLQSFVSFAIKVMTQMAEIEITVVDILQSVGRPAGKRGGARERGRKGEWGSANRLSM